MLGTSHFVPVMLLQSVTTLVALGSVGGHVPLRAALISLLEGRFGSSLGNLHWRAGDCFMECQCWRGCASPMEALSWPELAGAVLLVRKSRWQGKFNGISYNLPVGKEGPGNCGCGRERFDKRFKAVSVPGSKVYFRNWSAEAPGKHEKEVEVDMFSETLFQNAQTIQVFNNGNRNRDMFMGWNAIQLLKSIMF